MQLRKQLIKLYRGRASNNANSHSEDVDTHNISLDIFPHNISGFDKHHTNLKTSCQQGTAEAVIPFGIGTSVPRLTLLQYILIE